MLIYLLPVRLVEAVKEATGGVDVTNDDVYMATTFEEFIRAVVCISRGLSTTPEFTYEAQTLKANNMEIQYPNQMFINNEFLDASNGATFDTINPADESLICKVAKGTKEDVDYAVHCAHVSNCKGN